MYCIYNLTPIAIIKNKIKITLANVRNKLENKMIQKSFSGIASRNNHYCEINY
jgi:hypothetical protein